MGEEDNGDAFDKKKMHRERHSGRKAEKKKLKNKTENQSEIIPDRQRNPKAFAFNSAVRAERRFRRKQDIETKKQHVPVVDRTPIEPPPILIAVVGPPRVGKSTVINNLIKLFTKSPLSDIKGPVTIVTGKKRRITLIECNNDVNSMIDLAKIADLVLLLCDASFGFEMEIFEFLNICQVHGMPRVMGILTHLDLIKNSKTLKNTKKVLKHRFWTEVHAGAKLFYLSGIIHGEYLRNEVKNLGRFISVMKLRPLTWRTTHSYLLGDRWEDLTNMELIRQNPKCDRNVSLYGYVRGVPLAKNLSVHIAGLGDLKIQDMSYLPDPCPLPEVLKKRSLVEKEKLIYAPFSGVGGIIYDKDAVYVELGGSHSHKEGDSETSEAKKLLSTIIESKETADINRELTELQIFTGSQKILSKDVENMGLEKSINSDEDSEESSVENLKNTPDLEKRKINKNEDLDKDSSDEEDLEDALNQLWKQEKKDANTANKKKNVNRRKENQDLDKSFKTNQSENNSSDEEDLEDALKRIRKQKSSELQEEKIVEAGRTRRRVIFQEDDEEFARFLKTGGDSSEDSESEDSINERSKKKHSKRKHVQDVDDSDSSSEEEIKNEEYKELKDNKDKEIHDKVKSALKILEKRKSRKKNSEEKVLEPGESSNDSEEFTKESGKNAAIESCKKKRKKAAKPEEGIEIKSEKESESESENNSLKFPKEEPESESSSSEDSSPPSSVEENKKDKKSKLIQKDITEEQIDIKEDVSDESSSNEDDTGVKWKENLAKKARDAFLDRQKSTKNVMKLVYGVFDKNNFNVEEDTQDVKGQKEEEEKDIGGLFRLVTHEQKRLNEEKEKMNIQESSLFHTWYQEPKDWLDSENKMLIVDCFVTGKWKQSEDAQELLNLDEMPDFSDDNSEIYGDFEDLETGEKHTVNPDKKVDEKDDKVTERGEKRKADVEPPTRESLIEKKRKLKAKFDSEYDQVTESAYYDDLKTSAEKQSQLNKQVFENMPDDLRVQLEGFRPGMYVRIEFENVPSEFVTNFDATYPLLIGALNIGEENIGYVNVKIKKHRWYPKVLKTADPLIVSLGWRRFQTLPLFSKLEDDLKFRYLKYTPEHVMCNAHFWGPITPQGTGFLALQTVEARLENVKQQGFRIAATGSVQELEKSTQIMKKLKLIGYPMKIYKKTAFIKDMFSSALEVARFEGAKIKTVSGIRGQIKKAVSKPEGCFRATFEDKILLSDIVFCRTWYRVDVPRFYCSLNTLLLPAEQKKAWQGIRTTGQIKREKGIKNEASFDSLYTEIKRKPKVFKPLVIPRKLQAQLPYRDKPKFEPLKADRKPDVEKKRVAVVREPHEQKVAQMLKMLRASYEHKQAQQKAAMSERISKHQAQMEAQEAKKKQREKRERKDVFRKRSKAKILEEKKGGKQS